MTLAANRGAMPGPVGVESSKRERGRLPGPVGVDTGRGPAGGFLEETIPGGAITLELDNKNHEWRIKPPAFAHWNYYLPATGGKWARSGDEITISDANKKIHFSLKRANAMTGRACYGLSLTGRYELHTEWKRVPKPLPVSDRPPIWYGLAVGDRGRTVAGARMAEAVVVSSGKWFTFSMPAPAEGSFRGYGWSAAFVLLTGYLDRGDLICSPGRGVDYELSLGARWFEQAGPLTQIASGQSAGLVDFALRNTETLRALGTAALEGTCVDYDERHVILADLSGAAVRSGIYAYTGQCVQG